MNNFFDAIGIADMEKVHSAVIGWMLSCNCSAFNITTKSELLQNIFQVKKDDRVEKFDSIEVYIEWRNIDILILTKNKCWVIENKIKSSQHSDQLKRYAKILNCQKLMSPTQFQKYLDDQDGFPINNLKLKDNPYVSYEKAYCFLTLIDEQPIIDKDGVEWKNIHYSQLSGFVEEALSKAKKDHKDYIIINEYLECIKGLSSALNEFIKNPGKYPNVFEDGRKRKEDKEDKEDETQQYICTNGLETIFQKCFLSSLIPKTDFSKLISKPNRFKISETHGTAHVDFTYPPIQNVTFQIQFQDGTFKIQIIGDNVEAIPFLNAWNGKLNKYLENHHGWSVNKSQKEKKAYISISKYFFDKDVWFKLDLDTLQGRWNYAYKECTKMIEELKQIIDK